MGVPVLGARGINDANREDKATGRHSDYVRRASNASAVLPLHRQTEGGGAAELAAMPASQPEPSGDRSGGLG